MDEIVSKEPQRNLLIAHFGNGDESDQTLITSYAKKFGQVVRITIFPGISYGHMEFESVEAAARMMADIDRENVKTLKDENGKDRQLALFYTTLESDELKNKATVDFPVSVNAQTNSIPGLYVYDEFISEGNFQ